MDSHPSKLENNLNTLLAAMGALKQLKSEMQRKRGRKMKSWLQNVEAQEHELDEIQGELEQLKTPGLHRDKFNIRRNLNKRVIECLSVVEALQKPENTEVSREYGSDAETVINELEMLQTRRYSYDQLMNIITSDVIIGQGGFGDVYKGKIGTVEVAVKVLREEHKDKVMEKQFINEIRTMFSTSHQHLVKLYGYCFAPEKKALIYEYMANRSLDTILYKKKDRIPWETLYKIAIGTAKGIAHLHESGKEPIIHYDIKAANVLLDSDFSPKVTDFGLSKIYEKDVSHVIQTSIGGTAHYAAPEVRLGYKAITYKCDVFSFGLMLALEILRRKRITKNEDCWFPLKVWESLQNGMLENLLLNCGIEKKDIKQAKTFSIAGLWCIQFYPDKRPDMSDLVKVLQDLMQLPSDPPNPDMSGGSAHGAAPQRATSAGSYLYDERSDDEDDDDEDDDEEESWRKPKYASTSNLNNPVKPKRNTVKKVDFAKTPGESIQDELRERFKKVELPMQNKQSQLKEFQSMEERKIPKVPTGQGQSNMRRNANKEFNLPPTSAEAIPSVQNELKQRFSKMSSSRDPSKSAVGVTKVAAAADSGSEESDDDLGLRLFQ